MNPNVYLYKKSEKGFELYLGDFSTLEGLFCFKPQADAQIISFGASGYKKFGWASENEIPELNTVAEIIEFFKSEGEIGLIDFEAKIKDIGVIRTHDDSECHFIFSEKDQILDILKVAAPSEYLGLIFNKLIENPNFYITFDEFGKVNKYKTFVNYLDAENI